MFQGETYRSYLKGLLDDRISRNPAYTLQSFAQRVGLARGFISEVMSGKKNLSVETAAKICARLELPKDDADYFCMLVQLDRAKEPAYREMLLTKIETLRSSREVFDLTLDQFKAISGWYHFAIIDLIEGEGEKFTAKSAAERLATPVLQIEAAIERLIRLGLLERSASGSLRKTQGHFLVDSPLQHEAVVQFHRQMLQKLDVALEAQKKDERLSRTDVVLIDPALYPKVEEILDRAAQEVVALALNSKKKKRVCALSLHLFNVIPERKSIREN